MAVPVVLATFISCCLEVGTSQPGQFCLIETNDESVEGMGPRNDYGNLELFFLALIESVKLNLFIN